MEPKLKKEKTYISLFVIYTPKLMALVKSKLDVQNHVNLQGNFYTSIVNVSCYMYYFYCSLWDVMEFWDLWWSRTSVEFVTEIILHVTL